MSVRFNDAVQRVRKLGYAPAPIPKGHNMPPGPWATMQVPYQQDQGDADAALLLALRPAFGPGPLVVQRPQDTWLCTVTTTVKAELAASVDAIVSKYVGSGVKSPVLELPDGTTVRLFRNVGPEPFDAIGTIFSGRDFARAEGCGFLPLAGGQWRAGSPLTVPRDELPALDRERAKHLIADIDKFLYDSAPPVQQPVPRPVRPVRLPPVAKLGWDDADALERLQDNGYLACEVPPSGVGLQIAAPAIRRFRRGEGFTANDTGLVAVSVKSRLGESVFEMIRDRFGSVPVREDSAGVRLHVFRSEGRFSTVDEKRFSANDMLGTLTHVHVESWSGCVVLSGKDEAGKPYRWLDGRPTVLDTPRAELPLFNDGHAQQLLADIGYLIGRGSRAA